MPAPSASFPDLQDRGVLITGGASGIGAHWSRALRARGPRRLHRPRRRGGEALAAGLAGTLRHDPLFLAGDLTDIATIERLVAEAADRLGGLGVLVNNAARDDRHVFGQTSLAEWDESQAINLRPLFFTSQAAAPHLVRTRGAIVNFSSIAFLLNMAKCGLCGGESRHHRPDQVARGRLGPDGVRVNAILPGMVLTERQKALWLTEDKIAAMQARQC